MKSPPSSPIRPAELPADVAELQALVTRLRQENEYLKRMLFGRRSEKRVDDPGQGRLFGDALTPPAAAPPEEDDPDPPRRRRDRRDPQQPDQHVSPARDQSAGLPDPLANLPSTPVSQLDEWLPDQWQKRQLTPSVDGSLAESGSAARR
ncbi:MAG: transposase [Planctomycetota bacterium]